MADRPQVRLRPDEIHDRLGHLLVGKAEPKRPARIEVHERLLTQTRRVADAVGRRRRDEQQRRRAAPGRLGRRPGPGPAPPPDRWSPPPMNASGGAPRAREPFDPIAAVGRAGQLVPADVQSGPACSVEAEDHFGHGRGLVEKSPAIIHVELRPIVPSLVNAGDEPLPRRPAGGRVNPGHFAIALRHRRRQVGLAPRQRPGEDAGGQQAGGERGWRGGGA